MKIVVCLALAVALSGCATGSKKTRTNLAIDSEPTAPMERETPPAAPAPSDEPAPDGEIELGLEGNSTGPVVVDEGFAVEEPVAEEDSAKEGDENEEEAKKDEKPKKKPTGWATGNDESDFETDPKANVEVVPE